jgi:hypothetical protein
VFTAVAVAAQAQETESGSVEGQGWIWAKGSAVAVLDGKAKVHMAIDGDVVIYDLAGDAVVKIGSVPEGEPDGASGQLQEVTPTTTYTLDNFRGRLHIAGSDFRIEAAGELRFGGHGQGVVEVDGVGWWKTLHERGTWGGAVLYFGGSETQSG